MAINKNSNLYTFGFAILMVIIVGTVLALCSQLLKDRQDRNATVKKKMNILSAINIDANRENADTLFDKYVEESIIIKGDTSKNAFDIDIKKEYRDKNIKIEDRNYPLYICKIDSSKYYIIPLVGTGLWGPIWGYVSLKSDLKTIYGANFDHKTETPGLGAEIKLASFSDQYKNEIISDSTGKFQPIIVVKDGSGGKLNDPPNLKVDGITGGTITSKGVEEMTTRTLEVYANYFKSKN